MLAFLLAVGCGKEGQAARRAADDGVAVSRAAGRPRSATSCDSVPRVFCFRDTAYAETHDGVAGVDADWIWFGTANDSIEVLGDEGSLISTNVGTEHDAHHNNVPYFHGRLTSDGILVAEIAFLDRGVVVPYELRIRRQGPDAAALRPTGKSARLTIVSAQAIDPFTVIPLSLLPSIRDVTKWNVMAMPYNVVLVDDSLYRICRIPCTSPDTVKLVPGARVTRKYGSSRD